MLRRRAAGTLQERCRNAPRSHGLIQRLAGLLSQPELDDISKRLWSRYKISFPPEVEPADTVISRVSREISERLLSLRELSKIHTVAWQHKALPQCHILTHMVAP